MLQSLCIGDLNFWFPKFPIFYFNPCYMSDISSNNPDNSGTATSQELRHNPDNESATTAMAMLVFTLQC